MSASKDSFASAASLEVGSRRYRYFSLARFAAASKLDLQALPISHRVLLENLLRHEDGDAVTAADVLALARGERDRELAFTPARVLMQDFTGVPGVVDLAAMRDAVSARGGDPRRVNPLVPVDLVIDHSVMVDHHAAADAYRANVAIEMARNGERYRFLRWGQAAFDNFRVVPPGTGICHQVNLEYLARCVWTRTQGDLTWAYPDTLVGTDSHTTMINALGVLGWGVGGIEAEAAMLGQPIAMLIPQVVGVCLRGRLRAGVTATDLVLTVTELLRRHQVVGKFVEFHGPGLDHLPLAERATLANMAPEYGATCGFFPIDRHTLDYLELTGREPEQIALVEVYAKAQGLWRDPALTPAYDEHVELDLDAVVASVAGPRRPQDRLPLAALGRATREAIELRGRPPPATSSPGAGDRPLADGDLVIAAITSCTNTSNPAVMLAAGLVARKAVALGLRPKPWVKTSLAPGSRVVTEYLERTGLQRDLDLLGFNLVGYGCTTCIGNSGPLPPAIDAAIAAGDLTVGAVLSGNRNFEGRIHPRVRLNWLASPPLVVALALAGTTLVDPERDPLAITAAGVPVHLADLWPDGAELAAAMAWVERDLFVQQYARVFDGDAQWRALAVPQGDTYAWDPASTYIRRPPFFDAAAPAVAAIRDARLLALFGDSVTTDHISPAGDIDPDSPAGRYLLAQGVAVADFNSYGARRGNHEVMMRGTFANVRIRNELVPGVEGGYTRLPDRAELLPIFAAAMAYGQQAAPLLVIAGREYGTGSSRDWAAKGPRLLGVRAVIAESFERIHRSNLVGMGILPLEFVAGGRRELHLDGSERFHLEGLARLAPGQQLELVIERADGRRDRCPLRLRIDTDSELRYHRAGGILHHVLDQLAADRE